MPEYFINRDGFAEFLEKLIEDSKVIAPLPDFPPKADQPLADNRLHLQEITLPDLPKVKLAGFRTVEPIKSYLFKLMECVSEDPQSKNLIILGARACDLSALEVLDKVFGESDFIDPFYAAAREKITIISADCTDCGETCFCTLVKGQPYPDKFFDLNLSPLNEGYLIEVGSEKGQNLVESNKKWFAEANKSFLEEREANRRRVVNLIAEKNKDFLLKLDLSEIHKRNLENKVWKNLTKDCVECSACNFICPTCTCFLLLDQGKDERYKVWDACLKCAYAKVAGGANSRPLLYQRLQNRYHCKFDYSFDRISRYTCVGCGRCIDGCAGKIDMRKIFLELEKQVPLTAKLK